MRLQGSNSTVRQITYNVPNVLFWDGDAGREQLGQLFDTIPTSPTNAVELDCRQVPLLQGLLS
jgi:hypothetical protein